MDALIVLLSFRVSLKFINRVANFEMLIITDTKVHKTIIYR